MHTQVQRLAAMPRRPTALVCANGLLTPHVVQGIVSSGLRIPDDVSVLEAAALSPRVRALKRPAELAQDATPILPVYRHAL